MRTLSYRVLQARPRRSGTIGFVADQLVLVNGLPGSGKTTLAVALANDLGACLLSKDQIKEALAAILAAHTPTSLGAVTMETIWALARDIDGIAIIDSFWCRPRDIEFARDGIARSRAGNVVEVWCEVPANTARTRYSSRIRDPVHDDARRLASDWATWAQLAEPLAISSVIQVDTTTRGSIARVAGRVREQFAEGRQP